MSNGVEVKIALLQERMESLQKAVEDHINNELIDMKAIREEIAAINQTLTRYKGTLGGIVLTFSAMAAAATIAWQWLVKK